MDEIQEERIKNNVVVDRDYLDYLKEDLPKLKNIHENLGDFTISEILKTISDTIEDLERVIEDVGGFDEICSHCDLRK